VEDKTTKNNQDGCCAGRDKNTEPAKYRYNGCPSAYSIAFNVIYFREFVTVRELTVFSYAVFNIRTTPLLFRSVINYNNFQKRNCSGRKLTAILFLKHAIYQPINKKKRVALIMLIVALQFDVST